MKATILAWVCAPALGLLTLASATAADAELSVSGTITPNACHAQFSKGGVVDYGAIKRPNHSFNEPTRLETQYLTLTIECSSQSSFGIVVTDRQSDSVTGFVEQFLGVHPLAPLGFGWAGGRPLGAYVVSFVPTEQMADNVPVQVLQRGRNGGAWTVLETPELLTYPDDRQLHYSWASAGLAPGRYRRLSAGLEVRGAIQRQSLLAPGVDELVLQGLATLTLFHL